MIYYTKIVKGGGLCGKYRTMNNVKKRHTDKVRLKG